MFHAWLDPNTNSNSDSSHSTQYKARVTHNTVPIMDLVEEILELGHQVPGFACVSFISH